MSARPTKPRFRWAILTAGMATIGLLDGCTSTSDASGAVAAASAGPHVPDARTEANLLQMENQYLADKNSQPTHQHEVEAERKRQEEAERKQRQAAEQAKAGELKQGEAGK